MSARNQSRRRFYALVAGIAMLVILATVPVLGTVFAERALSPLAGIDHLGSLCLIALHFLLTPVHYLFQGMLVAGVLYAVWDRGTAWLAMRRVMRWLPAEPVQQGSVLDRAVATAGLSESTVRVVEGLGSPALTVGFLRPRIYVAASLATQLTFDELVAVFRHEAVHVDRRDPLRLSVLRFLSCMLFWIPALRRLADDVADEAELEADRHAAGDKPLVLASALVNLAGWRQPHAVHMLLVANAVGFVRDEMLNRRVRSLAGEPVPPRSHVSRGVAMSAVVAVAMTWAVGMVVSHPMPSSVMTETRHSFQTNWECLQARMTGTLHECPHTGMAH